MYDVWGKRLRGFKSMYVDSSACVTVKGNESEQFRIDSRARKWCIMSPWLFNIYMVAVMKMGMEKRRESGDYLASCMQMTWLCVVSRRRT